MTRVVLALVLLTASLGAQSDHRQCWMAVGPNRTAVTLDDMGGGWYALRVSDGGMVTGELLRFSPTLRQARVGTTAPAGWVNGGR